MKLLKRKIIDQKKRAQARGMMELQRAALAGMKDLNKEVASLKAEYEDLFMEIQKVIGLMDQEIEQAKATGQDTSEMEKKRSDLAGAMEEVKQAVEACPTTPFEIPAPT